jgi:hypothetical protein
MSSGTQKATNIWDGIPAELQPDKQDVGILLAILMKVIEAHAIYHDFDHARSLRAGERRLRRGWESNLVRASGLVTKIRLLGWAPAGEWNAKITTLAKHSRLLAQGIKSPGLKAFLLKESSFLSATNGEKPKKIDRLFYTYIEEGSLRRLAGPDRLAGWFVPGRPDRLIRYLRGERPYRRGAH